jgi:hypothetical protein
MTTESLPRAASAEHLTDALRRSGALGDGRVCDVVVESERATVLSRILRLRLTYEAACRRRAELHHPQDRAPGPRRRCVGRGPPRGRVLRSGCLRNAGGLVPRCFEAFYDVDTRDGYLLLEDLTDSHVIATVWPLPPTMEQCERILQARARFHAAWWDDPSPGRLPWDLDRRRCDGPIPEDIRGAIRALFRPHGRPPHARAAGPLRALARRGARACSRATTRIATSRSFTATRTCGTASCRARAGDDVRLFDWDLWRIDCASDDLAYMMAMHWYPDLRRRIERPLLDRYHAALVAHGVRGYDRRALADDYRLSVLWQITTPVWQATNDIPPGDLVEQPRAHPVGRRRSRLPRSAPLTTSGAAPPGL